MKVKIDDFLELVAEGCAVVSRAISVFRKAFDAIPLNSRGKHPVSAMSPCEMSVGLSSIVLTANLIRRRDATRRDATPTAATAAAVTMAKKTQQSRGPIRELRGSPTLAL